MAFFQFASAQKNLLARDENNKYIYYQIVDRPGVSADSLGKQAAGFIKSFFSTSKAIISNDTILSVKGYFETYSVLAFAKHESGKITFTFSFESRANKYRFWLTDFVFTPYERNRYGQFVPVIGRDIALEQSDIKIDKKELEGYLDQTGSYCQDLGARLKLYVVQDHQSKKGAATEQVKKITTKNW